LKEIERERTEMNLDQNQSFGTVHLLLYFSGKTGSVTFFAGAFNEPNVHQICQNLHETDHQTSLYVWAWSSPAHWQINEPGTTPKRPTQAACNCRFDNLTVYHVYFEQWLGSFPSKSRAEILPRCRRDYPLPLPINRG